MNREEKLSMMRDMLKLISLGSYNMPEYVFNYYQKHNIPAKQKHFYNIIADSFLTLYSFCTLINDGCWSQASTLLRMGLEQVAAIYIVSYTDGAMDSYINLQIEKDKCSGLSKEKQKEYLRRNGFRGKVSDYFDYSWIKEYTNDKTYGRDQLLKLAHLGEFLPDIEYTLNSFSHGTINIFQFEKGNWEFMKRYGDRITLTCCKLFDFLCCSYKNIIGDEFYNLPLNNYFINFKELYETYLIKEGIKREL